jgi:hypothetical protein
LPRPKTPASVTPVTTQHASARTVIVRVKKDLRFSPRTAADCPHKSIRIKASPRKTGRFSPGSWGKSLARPATAARSAKTNTGFTSDRASQNTENARDLFGRPLTFRLIMELARRPEYRRSGCRRRVLTPPRLRLAGSCSC